MSVLLRSCGLFWVGLVSLCLLSVEGSAAEGEAKAKNPALPKLSAVLGQGYGPSSNVYVEGEQRFLKGVVSFRSDGSDGEGVRVEKIVPDKVVVGSLFKYRYLVTNLTGYPLRNVRVNEVISGDFAVANVHPQASDQSANRLVWALDSMDVDERLEFTVEGRSSREGNIVTDGWVEYTTVLREQIQVVQPALEVTTLTPRVGVRCDRIGFKVLVRNVGTSDLTGVEVINQLSSGLLGEGPMAFKVGDLAPGEGRELGGFVTSDQSGEFSIATSARSREGAEEEFVAQFEVAAPVLEMNCVSTAEVYIGRAVEVCLTVTNKGCVAADDTRVLLDLPAFLELKEATVSGRREAGDDTAKATWVWDIGRLGSGKSREICATFTGDRAAFVGFRASGEAYCATSSEASTVTEIKGIPALSTALSDMTDPNPIGNEGVYLVQIKNQGSAEDTNLRLTCTMDERHEFVKVEGPTTSEVNGREVVFAPLERLEPGEIVEWRITLRAAKEGDARFTLSLIPDRMSRPVLETESTTHF